MPIIGQKISSQVSGTEEGEVWKFWKLTLFQAQYRKDEEARAEGKDGFLPENLGDRLLEDFRNYIGADGAVRGDRKEDYELYVWFVENILSSVNYEVTLRKCKEARLRNQRDIVSRAYKPSDEAFAIMLLVNYEKRWRNLVLHPTKSRSALNSGELYATKYTSSMRGYSKLSWKQEGIEEFNRWIRDIVELRKEAKTGRLLEECVERTISGRRKSRVKRRDHEVIQVLPTMGGDLMRELEDLDQMTASV